MTVAIIAENAVFALLIAAGWSLLRQGGGLQAKTPPVPKKETAPKVSAQVQAPEADETAPLPKVGRAA
jgi:hypothetical protein